MNRVIIQPQTSQANVIQSKQGARYFAAMRNAGKKMLYSEFGIALKYVIQIVTVAAGGAGCYLESTAPVGQVEKKLANIKTKV